MSEASTAAPSRAQIQAEGWHPGHNPWAIALTVTMATFMEVLDTSIANVALPHMAGSLSVSQDESTWVLTSYLVSNAIVLPISGWMMNRVGRKRFYISCVALFTLSSFLCGIAPSLGALIFFRVLQGVGGGGLGPSEQSILADTFPPEKRGMAFAVYGMAVVLAPALGPTLGGYITDNYAWRWVFFINVPVGIVSMLLASRMITDPPWLQKVKDNVGTIDVIGLGLITLGLGSLEVVLDKGQESDWFESSFVVGFSIVAAVSLISFILWELHTEHPVVDIRMFKSRTFAMANGMMFMLGLALFGTTVLLPQFTQVLLGYSAEQAGMALSPGGILIIFMMPFIGKFMDKVDTRKMIAFGFIALSASLFYMSHSLYLGIDFKHAILLRVYQAFGLAFLFVPINTLAYTDIAPEQSNAVSGMINLSRNMGGDVGIAAVTTLLAQRSQMHQTELVRHTTPFDAPFQARLDALTRSLEHSGASAADAALEAYRALYRMVLQQAQTLAYVDVIFLIACGTALMVPLAFLMKRPRPGAAAMGH
ncbi:MAG TPA: DHA2 family efflux MFS transporter permease subunit [Polyangiaceae bacterium]|jgi:DHA2 family multidrug resistance protein|nr:DHA2 family efflux MFS transporter permease subunit [Polyangiaceae bacterium]